MAVSYKKLWKLLIDRDMKKKDLEQLANVSHYTVSKMRRGQNVTTEILERICTTLGCSLDDIMEFVSETENENKGILGEVKRWVEVQKASKNGKRSAE